MADGRNLLFNGRQRGCITPLGTRKRKCEYVRFIFVATPPKQRLVVRFWLFDFTKILQQKIIFYTNLYWNLSLNVSTIPIKLKQNRVGICIWGTHITKKATIVILDGKFANCLEKYGRLVFGGGAWSNDWRNIIFLKESLCNHILYVVNWIACQIIKEVLILFCFITQYFVLQELL